MSVYENYGIQCDEGWKALYEPLIEMCKKDGVAILQIKEKYGGLRFYVGGDASDELRKAIDEAEVKSFKICEKCGNPGRLLTESWLMVRCDDCLKELLKEKNNA